MPKSRQQKESVLSQLLDNLKQAKAMVMASFTKLPVSLDRKLRDELFKAGVEYSVVKKTLLKKVFSQAGYAEPGIDQISGNVSLAISKTDEILPAKITSQFAQDNDSFQLVGGILESKWIDQARVEALAKLPGKPELIAKTVGAIKAPLNGLVNVLSGNIRGLINVLNGMAQAK